MLAGCAKNYTSVTYSVGSSSLMTLRCDSIPGMSVDECQSFLKDVLNIPNVKNVTFQ